MPFNKQCLSEAIQTHYNLNLPLLFGKKAEIFVRQFTKMVKFSVFYILHRSEAALRNTSEENAKKNL